MKLWVDDIRIPLKGYIWARSVKEVKRFCYQYLNADNVLEIEEFNLDHDAGDYFCEGGDYIKILEWLEYKKETSGWKINSTFKIHSGNIVGRQNMINIIQKNNWNLIS